jgi:hypothetical protein
MQKKGAAVMPALAYTGGTGMSDYCSPPCLIGFTLASHSADCYSIEEITK